MNRYPADAYRQLFPRPEERQPPPFHPAEDGDHYRPEPNFFEWWYFDVTLGDGSHLVAIFHSSLYNSVDHLPTLDIRYYPPARPPVTAIARWKRTAYHSTTDRCQVQIGDCSAVDAGDRYRLSLQLAPLAAELTFWPLLPGWRAGTGHLLFDEATGHYFDWVVPLPRARVEGWLAVAGERRDVTGTGYHDHNWGNLYLPAAFRHWTWGRALGEKWTFILGDLVGRGSPPCRVTPLMLAEGERIVLATDAVRCEYQDEIRLPQTKRRCYRQLRLTTSEKPTTGLTLRADRPIDALEFAAPHPLLARSPHLRGAAEIAFYLANRLPLAGQATGWLLGSGAYSRWEATYSLNVPSQQDVETGPALYEVMQLQREV